jgi:hypothetical protein
MVIKNAKKRIIINKNRYQVISRELGTEGR